MNKLLLTTLFCSIFLLTACGGGGSGDGNDSSGEGTGGGDDNGGGNNGGGDNNNGGGDDNNGGGDNNNSGATSVNGISPVTTLNIRDNFSYTVQGKNTTTSLKSGFDGDVQINRQTYTGSTIVSHNITLSNNTPSLNIVDIQKTETADVSCSNGLRAKGTQNYDYSSGQVVISGTYNGTSRSCTDIFSSPLPTTVTADTIENLLEGWGGNNTSADYISGTCPSDADDTEANKFDPLKYVCTGEVLTNYVITTRDPSKVHKLSILYKLNK